MFFCRVGEGRETVTLSFKRGPESLWVLGGRGATFTTHTVSDFFQLSEDFEDFEDVGSVRVRSK